MATAAVAFRDLAGSVVRLPLALRLALDDIHGRYRRTVLGPFWITLAQAVTVAGFVFVYSELFHQEPRAYALYLAAGIPIWMLIANYLSDMPNAFISARGFIESFGLPWLVHIWRRSIGYALTFLHHLVTFFVVMVWFLAEGWPVPNPEIMLLAVPALFVLTIAGTGVGIMLAVFGARYRDLQPAAQMSAGFLFMFSPVMWRPEQIQAKEWVYQYNPLYYFIKLLREPLLGRMPSPGLWLGCSAGAMALFALGFLVYYLSRRRLYHWI